MKRCHLFVLLLPVIILFGSLITDSAQLTYNANRLMVQYDFTNASQNRYAFEYTNGVLSKNKFYLDAGSGVPLVLWGIFTYEVTGGI